MADEKEIEVNEEPKKEKKLKPSKKGKKNKGDTISAADILDIPDGAPLDPEARKKRKERKPRKAREHRRRRPGLGLILIFILIPILLLSGGFVFAVVRFDFPPNVRGWTIDLINTLDPAHADLAGQRNRLAERELLAEMRHEDLDLWEAELWARRAELDNRENQLFVFQDEVIARENRLRPIFRQPMSAQDIEDLQSLSETYSQMAPEAAAAILAAMGDLQSAAAILHTMEERNAAAILAEMAPQLAANITQIILHY